MQLKHYLIETGWSQKVFAKKCGISEKTLWSILHGANPSLSTAEKIVNSSDHMVTFIDLCSCIVNKRPRKGNGPKHKPPLPKLARWKRLE